MSLAHALKTSALNAIGERVCAITGSTASACDRYIAEAARIGHLLGTVDLPTTYAATRLAVQLSAEPVQWMLNQQGMSAIARQRQRVRAGASYG